MDHFQSTTPLPALPLRRYENSVAYGSEVILSSDGELVIPVAATQDELLSGVSYFYCDDDRFFDPVHLFFKKRFSTTCFLTLPGALLDGLGTKGTIR